MGINNSDVKGKTPDQLVEHIGKKGVQYIKLMYDSCVQKRKLNEGDR